MILTKVYECDEAITLVSDYFEEVSGHKCYASERYAILNEETYQALKQASETEFDYEYYDSLLEESKEDEAIAYMQANDNAITLTDVNERLLSDLEELEEYIEYYKGGILPMLRTLSE